MKKVKEENEKVDLKLNIQKTKIMASGPITSWQIDGETVETVSDFIFWAPKSLQMVTSAMKLKDAYSLASLVAQTVKGLPAMQETQVRFLDQEGPLEKEMAIHSSTLLWKIPWTEETDRLQSMGLQTVGHN